MHKSGFRRLLYGVILCWLLCSLILVLPWRWLSPPTTSFMLRDGFERGVSPSYRWISLRQMSPYALIAVVAAEDQKFPVHYGFDFDAIAQALKDSKKRPRGASTISQQVAKNLYLWGGRSYVRKGLEAYLALCMELLWPKQRILEMYLNVAEFGPGVYGVAAASDEYFNKPAYRISLYESALLAAVLPNPKQMSVAVPSEYVQSRADEIIREVEGLGGVGYLQSIINL